MADRKDQIWRNAVQRKDVSEIRRLCTRGYNPDRPSVPYDGDGRGSNGFAPAVWFASVDDSRLAMLETLHATGADVVDARDATGQGLIHVAAQHGALQILKRLVAWGADLSAVHGREFSTSVAHDAAQCDQVSVLRWLFETDRSLLDKELLNGYTPACVAGLHGKLDALKVCVEFGYDVNKPIKSPDDEDISTLLDLAAMAGNKKIVTWLKKNGAKVTSESVNCARLGAAIPEEALKGKADMNSLEKDMKNILTKANNPIKRTEKSLAKKLLSEVCDYCGDSQPGVGLKLCGECRMVGYCSALCQKRHWKGHKPLCKAHQRGEEVSWPDANLSLRLKCAIQAGDFDLIKHLVNVERINLEDPINKYAVNEKAEPMTALQFAAAGGKTIGRAHAIGSVRLLVELGANLETSVAKSGYTAMFMAQNVRDIEMMKILRELGANINARDSNGQSLLHAAAYTDLPMDIKIARIVASWEGYDLNAQDDHGFTALGWAKGKGNPKMAKFLAEIGVSGGVDLDDSKAQMKEMFQHIDSGRLTLESVGLTLSTYRALRQQYG